MVVCRKNESNILFQVIKEVDPNAFMTFGSVMGVYGLGFEALKKIASGEMSRDSVPGPVRIRSILPVLGAWLPFSAV